METKGEMGKYLEQENYDILIMDIFGDFISDYKYSALIVRFTHQWTLIVSCDF